MDYIEALRIIPRSVVSIITLFLVTKIIGKKQVSQLSLFDYVIGISIGNFTAEMVMDIDGQYINGIVAMVTFGLFAYLVSHLTMKSITLRKLIVGVPTVLIDNGKIEIKALKKAGIDINGILEEARHNGYFNLNEISYAIMEADGKISFLPYDKNKPATKEDLKVKLQKDSLSANIIIDTKLILENISSTDKKLPWFIKEIKKQGYKDYHNIILAIYQNNTLTIYPKYQNVPPNPLE